MQYPAQVQATIDLLEMIESSESPADAIARQFFRRRRYIGSKDRKIISELTYKLLRHRDKLAWWAEKSKLGTEHSRSQVLLGLAFFNQLELNDFQRIFTGQKYQPETMSAEEVKGMTFIRDQDLSIDHPDMPDYVRLNLRQWSYEKLCKLFCDSIEDELKTLNGHAPLDLRVNTLRTTRAQVIEEFKKCNWPAEPTDLSPDGIRLERGKALTESRLFRSGYLEVQDEGSQIVALLCDAQPGQAVLDMCAGAGGKSLALAAAMKNKGRLIATDVSAFRLSKAKERLRRAEVSNHEVRLLDADGQQWLKRQKNRFDRVLLDVPCSGSGTWRRNPDLKWRFTEEDLAELQARQKEILESAAPLVKPGGYLIYATCSLYAEEDEQQIDNFMEENKQYSLVSCEDLWKKNISETYPGEGEMLRLTPFKHGTDGFFLAVLRKK